MNISAYVLVVIAGQAAPTEQISTVAPENSPQTWSVGAGVGFGQLDPPPSNLALSYGVQNGPTVTPRMSLERIMSPRWALGLGVMGYYQSARSDYSSQRGGLNLAVGPRWVVTPAESIIDLSLYAAVTAGYTLNQLSIPNSQLHKLQSFSFGIASGFVLERKFMERFSLRLNTQLIAAAMSWGRQQSTLGLGLGGTGSEGQLASESRVSSSVSNQVNLVPSPSLEFRVYF